MRKWKVRRNEYDGHDAEVHAVSAELQGRSESTDTADAQQRTDKSAAVQQCGADGTAITRDVNAWRPKVKT